MVAPAGKTKILLDASQRKWMADSSAVKLAIWHRQKGKDFTTSGDAVLDAAEKGTSWYIISLTQRQANETFDKCLFWSRYLAQELRDKMRVEDGEEYREYDDELDEWFTHRARMLFLPNGGRVVSLPGRNPDTIAGYTGNIIFTELALFPKGGYEHWRVVFPLTTRGYRIAGITTPRDKDTKAYELFKNPRVSTHFCDIYQSVFDEGFQLYDDDGKPYPMRTREEQETALENFKGLYNDEVGWQREYECKWMGALQQLLTMAQIMAAVQRGKGRPFDFLRVDNDAGWSPDFLRFLNKLEGRAELGWDVARNGHLSSLWINDGRPDSKHLRGLVLMSNTTFELQRQIVLAAMKLPNAVGCGDATGLGMDSNETLSNLFPGRWEGVNFAGTRKAEIASSIYTAFRDGTQSLPASATTGGEHSYIAKDFYGIKREGEILDVAGAQAAKTRLKLVEGQNPLLPESHCDIAYSGGLALRSGHVHTVQGGVIRWNDLMAEPQEATAGGDA